MNCTPLGSDVIAAVSTTEDRYTWLLEPEDLKGNTGVHYLVVRPVVGPGIKSINATLSITSITTACKFWSEATLDWSGRGCRVTPSVTSGGFCLFHRYHSLPSTLLSPCSPQVGARSSASLTQCLCNHLTFFGSSFFVTPNLVDPSRSAQLFASFAQNPVVGSFVAALFGVYLLAVAWARRKDLQDVAKVWSVRRERGGISFFCVLCSILSVVGGGGQVKVTVLQDNDPRDEYRYLLSIGTGHRRGASTSSQVTAFHTVCNFWNKTFSLSNSAGPGNDCEELRVIVGFFFIIHGCFSLINEHNNT